jgi:hypothetical protein
MNREVAETFLRLLAEAEMRDQLAPAPPPWAVGPGAGRVKVNVVGQALTAVRALDRETVRDILADFDLAVSLRRLHDKYGPGPAPTGPPGALPIRTMRAASAARLAAQLPFGQPGPRPARPAGLPRSLPPGSTGSSGPAAPPRPEHDDADQGTADRFVPIGLTIPFRDEGISGDLYLMSFAHSGSGARFIALWGKPTLSPQHELGLQPPELFPVGMFTVTDDRGSEYELDFTPSGGPEWISEINLRPAPPDGIRWLKIAAPPGPAVRVDLTPASGSPGGAAEVREAKLSPGEQLLIMLAERLLTVGAQYLLELRPGRPDIWPRPVQAMGVGLGDVIAGLEAVDVLSPLSPVPARLAALCASLRIGGHGIAAPPADDLPEPWLSLLAYYQRMKPDTAQVRDGYAALTAALPELDGIRLALVGLHNTRGSTVLHVLARGVTREERRGPHGVEMDFPLSIWLRDNGGRWHAGHLVDWHRARRERAIGLLLVPPLPRSTAWVEVLAGGRSAEVRTKVPLRWGSP